MHLDLLMCLNTFYSKTAELQSWKLACMSLSFTVQTMSNSKTGNYDLQNDGKKNISTETFNIHILCMRPVLLNPSSYCIYTASVLEIVENLLSRTVYAWAMLRRIFYQERPWLTTSKILPIAMVSLHPSKYLSTWKTLYVQNLAFFLGLCRDLKTSLEQKAVPIGCTN